MTLSLVQGNLVDCFGAFTNEAGSPADPTAVKFVFSCGTVGPTTYTYAGGSAAVTGTVWTTGTGNYTARIDTTALWGTLNMAFEGTGAVQAVGVDVVQITANPASV